MRLLLPIPADFCETMIFSHPAGDEGAVAVSVADVERVVRGLIEIDPGRRTDAKGGDLYAGKI
jgi:hypothetical protein